MSTLRIKKRAKKEKTTKNNKKAPKNRKILIIRLDNSVEIPAKAAYAKDNTKCFKISDINIDKIRVSKKKLYSKKHNSYKYYGFYEHNSEYIPLRIILKDVAGYYNDYSKFGNNNAKKMILGLMVMIMMIHY